VGSSPSTIEPTEYIRRSTKSLRRRGCCQAVERVGGHNLCFPTGRSQQRIPVRMTLMGNGHRRWRKIAERQEGTTANHDSSGSLSRGRDSRTISNCWRPVVYFDNRAENLSALDRPVGWCEHVTVGPPFLRKGVTLDASLTRDATSATARGKASSGRSAGRNHRQLANGA
jgi:hypothetical protein